MMQGDVPSGGVIGSARSATGKGSGMGLKAAGVRPRSVSKGSVVPALMTIDDAARRLALSPSMVRKMIAGDQLEAIRIGRAVRIRVDDVEAIVVAGGQ